MHFHWPLSYKLLHSSMRLTIFQLHKAIEDIEKERERIQIEISKYELGLISTNQHKVNKKYRAKLNKEIKELKREIELNQK